MTSANLSSAPSNSRWLAVVVALVVLAMGVHGPVAQWPEYHAFADTRVWLGMPNAANVLSNLPFAAIGSWGLWRLVRSSRPGPARTTALPWLVFCAALICTAVGSAVYHWAPDNASLVIDRLPIAWACAALLCGFLGERVHERWESSRTLAAALVVASLSVAYWYWTESLGRGDLRAYLFVQFLPMLLIPVALIQRLPMHREGAVSARTWCLVLGLYAAAKGMEIADHLVLQATQWVSGHMLKHLLAAFAAACLVAALIRRPGTRSASRISSDSPR